jgi:hypothetical protein
VFVLFKKYSRHFFKWNTPTSEENIKFEKTRIRKISFHVYKFKLAGE